MLRELHSSFKHFSRLSKAEEAHEAGTQQLCYSDHPSLVSLTAPRTWNNQWENSLDH